MQIVRGAQSYNSLHAQKSMEAKKTDTQQYTTMWIYSLCLLMFVFNMHRLYNHIILNIRKWGGGYICKNYLSWARARHITMNESSHIKNDSYHAACYNQPHNENKRRAILIIEIHYYHYILYSLLFWYVSTLYTKCTARLFVVCCVSHVWPRPRIAAHTT